MQFLSVTEDFVAFAFPRRPHLSEEALMAVVILSEAKDLNRRSTKFAESSRFPVRRYWLPKAEN
jgi:hypothetical protein